MKALHFGAGNIGRGFIGLLLHKAGYSVCFVDVDEAAVQRLNDEQAYKVKYLDDEGTTETISTVSALNSRTQEEEVVQSIEQADIITTSVGVQNLPRIAPVLAEGLRRRTADSSKKLNVIANENAVYASSTLKKEIEKQVSSEEMEAILGQTGFPNTAVDRLALTSEEESTTALVEPSFEWVIHTKDIADTGLPRIPDASYVEDLDPYIQRKLYIINMGHAAAAYYGYLHGYTTIQDALTHPDIRQFVSDVMHESARYFVEVFPIAEAELERYIKKTLQRFENPNISDSVFRVGRAPMRKLGPDERIVTPMTKLHSLELPVSHLITAAAAGFHFTAAEDEEAVRIQTMISENGIRRTVEDITGITDTRLLDQLASRYEELTLSKRMNGYLKKG
ncbi:mannitol-1-phosphate 5-dehydrogenase [Alkalicoccus urumqiensis]|uniref:Mannitol-1-phosphate 5-dehydrogenase n=1 Tax=Alkalicoccus urumqiensis TaxID=1548213 RepID=A0A2P6MJG2_ALKUR|nr:mannitol-1-phosphate 5-dehydrogenase [Alkalicoccus urumqiensis]PRO66411.1 mannitol-1-phosphate 5-dehydrogenase [Alkalicoccus urumqiensis]